MAISNELIRKKSGEKITKWKKFL